MGKVTFGKKVLQVEGLKVKFDVVPVSSSLALLIGDKDSASIVQQLYHWTEQGYGEVIDGVRWIYKSVKEWIEEVFPTYTSYQLSKMMKQLSDRGIIRREKLFTKHQIQSGDRFWWQPKNQTYYYSLNYKKLQELADSFDLGQEKAETLETSVSLKTQTLSNEEIEDTKLSDCSKNNTENTSIENNSRDLSHPTLPCECEAKEKEDNQRKQDFNNSGLLEIEEVDSANLQNLEQDTNCAQVEENINQYIGTEKDLAHPETEELQKTDRPSPKLRADERGLGGFPHERLVQEATKTKHPRENKAPWQDELQRSQFYRALIQALPIVANSHSPQGLAKTIIAQLKRGEEHTYWDDFAAGLPIGASTKPEWEVEPGVPYPMFIEYLTEKIIRGNNTQTHEQARNEVFRILSQPRQATAFWGQFKRSVVNVSEQVERDRALGVSNPNTPVWSRERTEPSVEEAEKAGQKIMTVNGTTQSVIEGARNPQLESKPQPPTPDPWINKSELEPEPKPKSRLSLREMLAARGVKGFCKSMPKVSKAEIEKEERAEIEPKTNIATMAIAEINDYLTDPILRAQLTPQLYQSDYELITDELGQIIRVELSELQKREKQSQKLGE